MIEEEHTTQKIRVSSEFKMLMNHNVKAFSHYEGISDENSVSNDSSDSE